MKIVVGGLYHESNTFNPFVTTDQGFVVVEGDEMLDRVAATSVFREAGAEVIPAVYAFGLPSGIVTYETYRLFADKMLDTLRRESDVDGVWLHLHGSMVVENVGSGELQLLKEMRAMIGKDVPISLTLDIHANNAAELAEYANIIRAYRTVPHVDQPETEVITARLLLKCLKDKARIKPAFARLPLVIGGEKALGAVDPLKSIFAKLEEMERSEGIAAASFFICFSWGDTEHTASSVVVVPESETYTELAAAKAKQLADYVYARRHDFDFEAVALKPQEAVKTALASDLKSVFISDSGDNTTGGAVGFNTVLLDLFLKQKDYKGKKVLLTAIFDPEAYKQCEKHQVGDSVKVNMGAGYDENSKRIAVEGMLKAKGDLLGYLGCETDKVGGVCTITVGDLDVAVADKADSFITLGHFKAAGLNIDEYDIICVKQGYLFAELRDISKLAILALTPGATYQIIEELEYKHIPRPAFPFDNI